MKNKFISLLLVILMSFSIIGCSVTENKLPNNSSNSNDGIYTDSEINQLSLLKTDAKFSQEQMLSRIKAEYLKENGGYKSEDKVSVIITLSNAPLIDAYNEKANKTYSKISEFVLSKEGQTIRNSISKEQNDLTSYLLRRGLIDGVTYNYSTVMNGVAVTASYGDLDKIQSLSGVESVILSDTYNRPQSESSSGDVSQIRNVVSIDPNTGIYLNDYLDENGNPKYTGDGTSVAVLDSGFDMSHSVFQNYNITDDPEMIITRAEVNALINKKEGENFVMNASQTTEGLKISDVYRNIKIPYYYDYADKDPDVFPYDSEHGTHVAGIIGGQSSEEELESVKDGGKAIKGIAVNTQLVLMKVFPDLQEGGKTEDIVAAVEDAVNLGVDAINMSLGSSCGFVRERDKDEINSAYDKVKEAGISLITAASNSYSSSFSGAHGNTNFVQNPDSGTVGSPSTYDAALSVASISGTLSNYLTADGNYPFFYTEANYLTGKSKVFVDELYAKLEKDKDEKIEIGYVAVPGIGADANYSRINVEGKIALVRRGDNTFEQKAAIAKANGAIGCIIYNNIDGTIIMSVGKEPQKGGSTEEIFPIISVSKDIGEELASRGEGILTVDANKDTGYAGPFMSDFSSWGPTPSLELKPEITSHGGNILSAIPGGGYDEQSGTSMATPNLCGVVLLIRQYVKYELNIHDPKDVTAITNQLLMSTATIAMNEEGNPYSPRKQGAGLASLINSVSTKAYITVDGKDRPKIELFDDPQRTGVYTMDFNIVNMGATSLTYDVDMIGMTESVSTSDDEHVAETPHVLSKNYDFEVKEGGTKSGNTVTVGAGQTAKIRLVYTLSKEDKKFIDDMFPYGMYVEGFVKLISKNDDKVDLNAPFLAFYGDWTEAPMFDKTYYEVETEAHDGSIDPEDKLTADYYATIPYGSYYYNYIIPMGTYLYDMDTSKYEAIPATEEHAAMSNVLGTIDGLSSIYAGLFRNAATMTYTLTDKVTGETVWEYVEYNARKAYSNGAQAIPYNNFLNIRSTQFGDTGLINNHRYNLTLTARMDYARPDGEGNMVVCDGIDTNKRNTFSFDFTMDTEAPVIKSATYEKKYDRGLKKYRYYVNLTVFDNHYAMAVTPIIFTSSSTYGTLGDPIPLYGERNKDYSVRFEITDILEDIGTDAVLTSGIGFSIEDYALNTNLYLCQLPGTAPGLDPENPGSGFTFTADGTKDGGKIMPTVEVGEVVDLIQYLYTDDNSVDEDKSYLKHLVWKSGNESIALVQEGQLLALKKGSVTVTVTENVNGRSASMIVKVVNPTSQTSVEPTSLTRNPRRSNGAVTEDYSSATVESMRFSYFDTLFAYSRAAQTSEIGQTDSRMYISSLQGADLNKKTVSLYPGEKIKFSFDFDPWYAKSNYDFIYESSNSDNVKIEQDGTMTALKEGTSTITLTPVHKVTGERSNVRASIKVVVKNEFIIENRMLIAYKGLGGDVVIPDDEGILYIGAYAFCLYDTDISIELPEDDYDANKIPTGNTAVTSIVVPEGVEEIQKYAFYNCPSLKRVELPRSVKFVREFAFAKDAKLEEVTNLDVPFTFGAYCFYGCESLTSAKTSNAYALGRNAFQDCTSLEEVDILPLRNAGGWTFSGCTSLKNVTFGEYTKLSYAMFEMSGLEEVVLYETLEIPEYCFFRCDDLSSVSFEKDLISINLRAFRECKNLGSITFKGTVGLIGEEAFLGANALETLTLPEGEVDFGHQAFGACPKLSTVVFGETTKLGDIKGSIFFAEETPVLDGHKLTLDERKTIITEFTVDQNNPYYAVDGNFLVDKATGSTVYLAKTGVNYGADGDFTLDEKYTKISNAAFTGTNITKLTVTGDLEIGAYAFVISPYIVQVVLPSDKAISIGNHAFNAALNLKNVNLEGVDSVGDYAFARTALNDADFVLTTKANSTYGEGAFYSSKLVKASLGANSTYGMGAFMSCSYLEEVSIPERGATDTGVVLSVNAFVDCVELKSFSFSGISEVIPDYAFAGCEKLPSIVAPHVTYIGEAAFLDCLSVNVTDLSSVESIGAYAFASNSSYIDEQTSTAPSFSTILLPNVRFIGNAAFRGCIKLTEIDLSASENLVMEGYAFAQCMALVSAKIPVSLTRIGEFAFAGCVNLLSINLENVEYVDQYAFRGCSSLFGGEDKNEASLVNLSSLKEVGEAGFAQTGMEGIVNAPVLEKVGAYAFMESPVSTIIAENLAIIEEGAFCEMPKLVSFTFSEKLESLGIIAFGDSANLKTFFGPNGSSDEVINDYAKLIDGVLYAVENGVPTLKSVPMAKTFEEDTFVVEEGTLRIDIYGGNKNPNVKKLVLPTTLRIVGAYGFYGYDALVSVEFKTVSAPILESMYNPDFILEEKDPGFGLLHGFIDLFGWELCYCNFIDLVGKKEPIKMILPANKKVEGYDSIVYLAYFGAVEDAERSNETVMETNLINFIDYAKAIMAKDNISLTDGALVNNAVLAYNSLTQKGTDFGISETDWNAMIKAVNDAKVTYTQDSKINELRLERVDKSVIDLQNEIFALTADADEELIQSISERLSSLPEKEKNLLDLSNYNAIVGPITPDDSSSSSSSTGPISSSTGEGGGNGLLALWIVLGVLGAAAISIAVVFIIKRRKA